MKLFSLRGTVVYCIARSEATMEYDPQGLGEPRWALYGSLESLESNCDRTQIFTFVIFPDLNQKYE